MNAAARLGAFAGALGVVFVASYGLGSAVDPIDGGADSDPPAVEGAPGGGAPDTGGH